MRDLVPIGRFSAMTRLSVKALRHYDEVGLLRPAEVDPGSGYRYYRIGQANQAEAIRVLRTLETPLDTIAAVLAATDDEAVEAILEEQRTRIAAGLERHQRMLTFIERLITGEAQLLRYDIAIAEVDDQRIASLVGSTSLEDVAGLFHDGLTAVAKALAEAGGSPTGAPFAIFHDVIDADTDGRIELCVPTAVDVSAGEVTTRTLVGGPVARTLHRGPFDEIAPAYHAVMAWVAEHGHEFDGPPREVYVSDPSEVAAEDLLAEVLWPIR